MAWTGTACCQAGIAVDGRNCPSRFYVSRWTVDRVAAVGGARHVFCDEPEQPLLLPDYSDPRNPSGARHSCPGNGAWRAVSVAAGGDATNCSRMHGVVLAHYGHLLGLPLCV